MQIICIGDLCCDLVVPYGKMREILASGDIRKETISKMQVRMQCGGSVGNVAGHLGKMGLRPVFATPVGRDPLGDYLSEEMEKSGVDMRWASESPRSNMYCVAVLDQTGERTMFCFVPPWADYPRFGKHSFDRIPAFPGEILFTSGMAILDDAENNAAVLEFFTKRKQNGAKIVFDLNVRAESYGYEGERKASLEKMIALSDILLGSGKEEFSQVTGSRDIRAAAGRLLQAGAGCVIARDGGNPILVLGSGLDQYIPVKRVKPVSTIGAGDCFDAAFLKDISSGRDLLTAVRNASDYTGKFLAGGSPEAAGQSD
ncbi:MAG: carbohydrate kinase family protein [Blautia sp.]|nr:carbohydrate kinase family protein [Blautia sp.]